MLRLLISYSRVKVKYRLSCLLALILLSGIGCKEKTSDPEIIPEMKVVRDLPYIAGDTTFRHQLDVYYEINTNPAKVIFFVPGGAWKQGDKNMYDEFGQTLCKYYHYTVVVINYRLSDSTQGNAVHPEHMQDVAAAYKWALQHISGYNGDPQRMFVFGQSAGAHLAALLVADPQYLAHEGLNADQVKGLIIMSGPYNLNHFVTYPMNPVGLSLTDVLMYRVMVDNAFGTLDSTLLSAASPASYAIQNLPPTLIITTEYDMPGLPEENELFYSQLAGLGSVPVSFYKIFKADYSAETWAKATAMAEAEPAVSDYIGHYAELVAVNEQDKNKVPTTWIVSFINQH